MSSRNRGRPKPKLRDLSREWRSLEESQKLLGELPKLASSPISIAILCTSLVEQELERLLRDRFARKDEKTWSDLTGDRGPLGTFSSKIIAGFAFKLYDEPMRDCLDVIRNIRNAFAHSKRLIDFEHPLIRRELQSVPLPENIRTARYKRLSAVRAMPDGGMIGFVALCSFVGEHLVGKQAAKLRRQTRGKKTVSPQILAVAQALMGLPPESPEPL